MEEKQQIPKEVLSFLESLMIEKGADILPANIKADILYDLYTRYENFLMVAFLKEMSAETEDKFGKLLEQKAKKEEVTEFLKSNTEYSRIVKEVSEDFKKTYLGK